MTIKEQQLTEKQAFFLLSENTNLTRNQIKNTISIKEHLNEDFLLGFVRAGETPTKKKKTVYVKKRSPRENHLRNKRVKKHRLGYAEGLTEIKQFIKEAVTS